MKRKEKHRVLHQLQYHQKYHNPSSYPSYSSNAILHTSTCRSNKRLRQVYHCSRQHQSTARIPSQSPYQQSIKTELSLPKPLSSHILDNLVYIDQKESISGIQILPQQVHTLQILQNNRTHPVISSDSLATKDMFIRSFTPCYLQNITREQTSGMGDQLNLNKVDVATQWSLQILTSKYIDIDLFKPDSFSTTHNKQADFRLHLTQTNSTILTELSQSMTTIATNSVKRKIPSVSETRSFVDKSPLENDCM